MRLSRDNRIACWGFAIMAAIGIYYLFTPKFLTPLHNLNHVGTTTATLDNEYTKRTDRGITSYNIGYAYKVDGKDFHGTSAVDNPPSETMPVQYVTDDPGTSGMDLRGQAWFDLGLFAIPVIVFMLSSLALVIHMRTPAIAAQPAPQRRR